MSYAYGSQYKTYQQAFAAYEDMCASGEVTPSEVEGIIKRGKYWYIIVRERA